MEHLYSCIWKSLDGTENVTNIVNCWTIVHLEASHSHVQNQCLGAHLCLHSMLTE